MRDPAKATMDRAANAPRDMASESDGVVERTTSEQGGSASLRRGSGEPVALRGSDVSKALHGPSVREQEDAKDKQQTDALVSVVLKLRLRPRESERTEPVPSTSKTEDEIDAYVTSVNKRSFNWDDEKAIDDELHEVLRGWTASRNQRTIENQMQLERSRNIRRRYLQVELKHEREIQSEIERMLERERDVGPELEDEDKDEVERERANAAPTPGGAPPSNA